MTSSRRWWFAAFVAAVFLAGSSVGVIVDRLWLLPRASIDSRPVVVVGQRGPSAEAAANRIVEANLARLGAQLDLTAAQYNAARPMLETWVARIGALQASTREGLLAETQHLEDQLSSVLTPEQRDRLSAARRFLLVPNTGRGRFGGPDEGRSGRGPGRGPQRPGGPGRE
jgi:hypothetical protein